MPTQQQLNADLRLVIDAQVRELTPSEQRRLDALAVHVARLQVDNWRKQRANESSAQGAARRMRGRRALATVLNVAEQDDVVAQSMIAAACLFATKNNDHLKLAKVCLGKGNVVRERRRAADRAARYLVRFESLVQQGMKERAAAELIGRTSRPKLTPEAINNALSKARTARGAKPV